MNVSLSITAPASTTKVNAVAASTAIGPCRLKKLTAQFPAGCQYLAKLAVYIAMPGNPRNPVLPSYQADDGKDYVAFDDFVVPVDLDIELLYQTMLYAKLWNDDTANAHTINITLATEPLEV